METHITQCTYKQDLLEPKGIFNIIKNTNYSNFSLVYSYNCLTVQNSTNAMSVESKLWDPPLKNGTQVADKEEPSPDWQQLLK